MSIGFRVDASSAIGTGHVMRCRTLALELKERGEQIVFYCRQLTPQLAERLSLDGFSVQLLGQTGPVTYDVEEGVTVPHSAWLGCSQREDVADCLHWIGTETLSWMVVDHYALDERWHRKIAEGAERVLVIDDLADRRLYCDLLLDQNFYRQPAKRYEGLVPDKSVTLIGPKFSLLRADFALSRALNSRVRTGRIDKVLVFFGGADSANLTEPTVRVLGELSAIDNPLNVDVVIGGSHSRSAEISELCDLFGFNCYVETSAMAELMSAADIMIGAGGGVNWERCCLGLPSLSFVVAENQRVLLDELADLGVAWVPVVNELSDSALKNSIKDSLNWLRDNPASVRASGKIASQLVDGHGVSRVARAMGVSRVSVRRAELGDCLNVYNWRNHESVRNVSRSSAEISYEDHKTWFVASLNSPSRVILLGELDNVGFGVVRFDLVDNCAEVSIYLSPEITPPQKGLGSELLLAAELWIRNSFPEIKEFSALVMADNLASHGLFRTSAYQRKLALYSKGVSS